MRSIFAWLRRGRVDGHRREDPQNYGPEEHASGNRGPPGDA
jgi:hypothetical protein